MFQSKIDNSNETLKKMILNKLPAFRNSLNQSNNQKLLSIIADWSNKYKNNLSNVHDLTLITTAKGKTLTNLAKDYDINRIDSDDEFLRFELRWQILKSQTPTTMNGLKRLISLLLNVKLSEFDVVGTSNYNELEIKNVPFDFATGSHAALKKDILFNSIQSCLPVNYHLKDIEYSKNSEQNLYFATFSHIKHYKESEVTYLVDIR